MTKTHVEVKVCIEHAIHDAISDAVQEIFDRYGVCIKEISIGWIDYSTPSEIDRKVNSIEMLTHVKPTGGGAG